MAAATVFAEIIAAWSAEPRFLLNLPLFERERFHPDVDRLVGDFTNSVLLAVDASTPMSFLDRARIVQRQFHSDAVYADYSGVEVLRDLTRAHRGEQVLAPVVYTSALNVGELFSEEFQRYFGQPAWIISQVPQVWLDAQLSEVRGGLLVNWDALENAFPDGVLDAMFDAYRSLFRSLIEGDRSWDEPVVVPLPPGRGAARPAHGPAAADPLQAFLACARRRPNHPALVGHDGTVVSYGELAERAGRVGALLAHTGLSGGDTVGIAVPQGSAQVAAVLGVLHAGGAFCVLDDVPPAHRHGAPLSCVLAAGRPAGWAGAPVVRIDDVADVAAVDPADVVDGDASAQIRHTVTDDAGAGWSVATHHDVRGMLAEWDDHIGIGPADRVLVPADLAGLSPTALLAPLASGATVVLGAATAVDVVGAGITVLVAPVDRLDDVLGAHPPASLRAVVAVGDAVPARPAVRLLDARPDATMLVLGFLSDTGVPRTVHRMSADDLTQPLRPTLPAGVPVRGTHLRVLDELGRDRPDHVPGRLWVDTASHGSIPTGDHARYRPGGLLEYAGVAAGFVLVRGRRLPLGAVERVLDGLPGIEHAVAALPGPGHLGPVVAVVPTAAVVPGVSDVEAVASIDPAPEVPLPSEQHPTDELEAALTETLLANVLLLGSGLQPTPRPFVDLCTEFGIAEDNVAVYRLWLGWLAGRDVVAANQHGYAVGPRFDDVAGLRRWARLTGQASGTHLAPLLPRLQQHASRLPSMLRGELDVRELVVDPVLAPDAQLDALPATAEGIAWLAATVQRLAAELDRPLELAEMVARSGRTAARLREALAGAPIVYTVLDPSSVMVKAAAERLRDGPGELRMRQVGEVVPDDLRQRFDVVVANNALHTFSDVSTGPAVAAALLAPHGVLLALEQTELPPLALVTAALPARGFPVVDRRRRDAGTPMLDGAGWCQVLSADRFDQPRARHGRGGMIHLWARRRAESGLVNVADLYARLRHALPTSLVPDRVVVLTGAPRTAGGDVDRPAVRRLLATHLHEVEPRAHQEPQGRVERAVADLWRDVLACERVGRTDDFFVLGGDSLLATRLVTRLQAVGLDGGEIAALFEHPDLAGFAATLRPGGGRVGAAVVPADPAHRHDPFPPTDVQRAYWLGRGSGFTLGGIGCHFYREYDVADLDPERLEEAVHRLVARHEMLRVVFDDDGNQVILRETPRFRVTVVEAGEDPGAGLAALRESMSHQVFDPSRWPLFAIRGVRTGSVTRIGIGVDNIVLDALSVLIFYAELSRLYADLDADLAPVGISFRDYVLGAGAAPDAVAAAQDHWTARLADIPPAPQLPLALDPANVVAPRFTRRTTSLDRRRWRRILDRCRQHGLTPSAVLLSAFTEVLATWGGRPDLTVTVTLFDRRDVHADINNVLGDFTSLLLVSSDAEPAVSYLARARRLQERMWRDLDHRDVSAVWVLRELGRRQQQPEMTMPVVFTSALGVAGAVVEPDLPLLAEPVWGISQTPQVWLDHQVVEAAGGVTLNWDAVEELFADGVLDAMFDAYRRLLDRLADTDWTDPVPDLLPPEQRAVRELVNTTAAAERVQVLHRGFFDQAVRYPDRLAVIGTGATAGTLAYGELADRALRVAAILRSRGLREGDPVGVSLPKGPDQVVAVLGVLAAGGVYVPVGIDQPVARRARIHRTAGVRLVLVDELQRALQTWSHDDEPVLVDRAAAVAEPLAPPVFPDPDSPAYVIFTSGSTGAPKGVEITHRAAMNTVEDLNDRFAVGPRDRVLAVSALDFDLSVYDIFGLMSAGGTVVCIDEDTRRDARRWLELADEHRITLWNTVPTLLDMLLVVAEAQYGRLPSTLRRALVSGDWVGLDLPGRLAAAAPSCALAALGGATEAAIWSNLFEIADGEVPTRWRSIPYGRPLRNQRYRVVDPQGRDCPDWVPGELWIGGAGVARGYRGDPEATARRFVEWEGQRWYRTGDLGRYWPDGTLEFLGRVDHQVKIRGHRIELGEIEAALREEVSVEQAVATVTGDGAGRRLAAVVVGEGLDAELVRARLATRLPAHMMPERVRVLPTLPLSANGKVDRAAVRALATGAGRPEDTWQEPRGDSEQAMAGIWVDLLQVSDVGRDQSFFTLGGDSLLATRLVERIRRELGAEVPLRRLFTGPTVRELALAVDELRGGTHVEEGLL